MKKLLLSLSRTKRFIIVLSTFSCIMILISNCSDDDSDENEIKDLLTTGIWELSEESDQGLIGAHFQFNSDGTGTVYFEGSLFMEFQWKLENDNTTLVLSALNDSDSFEIEKLTKTDLILIALGTENRLIFFKVTD
jgi:hypothetical protein